MSLSIEDIQHRRYRLGIQKDNITRQQIMDNWAAFGFASPAHVERYERLLKQGFRLISEQAAWAGQILADTKFEFGYATEDEDDDSLIYIDEVGTLDSSRLS